MPLILEMRTSSSLRELLLEPLRSAGRQATAHPGPAVLLLDPLFGKSHPFGLLENWIKPVKAAMMLDVADYKTFSGLAHG